MRRVLGTVAAALLVVCAISVPLPAGAQGTGVTLQLLRQSPWSSAYRRSTLDIEVLASNSGTQTLGDLQLAVAFGPHLATQTDFENMLDAGATEVIATATKDVGGRLEAGSARTLSISIDLATLGGIDQTDAQTYPATVQLLAHGSVLASLVTPAIYLVRPPVAPLLATTWIELSAPVAFDPSGRLTDQSFPAALAPRGALRAPVSALAGVTGGRGARGAFDAVIDPLVITQARDVADGYDSTNGAQVAATDPVARQAARFLRTLTTVATTPDHVETVAAPYANPLLPAMLTSSLDAELAAERVAGATIVSSLGGTTAMNVARPSQGALSDGALEWLAGVGTSVVLANADTVDRSVVQSATAPAPTVPVSTPSGETTMVLPDPDVQALFERSDLLADPVRAAQVVLGELALIWKQQPVPSAPTIRGIAVAPPGSAPAQLWAPLLDRLADAPFLSPVTATDLVANASPEVPNQELPLAAPSAAQFDPVYAGEIQHQSDRVEAFGSMVVDQPDTTTAVRRDLFLATTPDATVDSSVGQPWIDDVAATTQRAFDVVTPSVSHLFTFTSREGEIPLVMGDPGDMALRVTIELRSNNFSFPDGSTTEIVVDRPGMVVTIRVLATSSGQSPIQIWTRAPNGQPIADPITIVVRSTAANRIALLVTLLAAVGLLVLYSRRWWRRRTNPA